MIALEHPAWLILLAPLLALAIWLLLSRGAPTAVPFVALWPADRSLAGARRRRWSRPPLFVLLLLLAILCAIGAAASPRWIRPGSRGAHGIVILLDRGLTMSARGQSDLRYRETARSAAAILRARLGDGPVELIVLPGGQRIRTTLAQWDRDAECATPVPSESTEAMRLAIARELMAHNLPVLAVSDRDLSFDNPRFARVAPPEPLTNVGIIAVAISPPPVQLMVRIKNDSPRQTASLQIAGVTPTQLDDIRLPASGQSKDFFFDLAAMPSTAEVRLATSDNLPADDFAKILSAEGWRRIESSTPLPDSLRWIVDVYSRQHPAPADAGRVVIVDSAAKLSVGEPGIALAVQQSAPAAPQSAREESPKLLAHPLTNHIDWPAVLVHAPNPPLLEGDNWQPLVTCSGRPALAIRDNPVRQVWVGFDSTRFEKQADFPIFWQNVFNWTAAQSAPRVEVCDPFVPPTPSDPAWPDRITSAALAGSPALLLRPWLASLAGIVIAASLGLAALQSPYKAAKSRPARP